ncbi:hypothetical protein ELE36_17125 [Pseudolysobacter antarcticus]|uniref:Uncharacterized protein n=1 Tax=Pseudolysobacter antarcticus TaxID=2511995 RepID=A0A411HN81_9GAMM|nr:hypothetical protein [Pseudolysobacter antarcticus]QBB71943.1 hypothetical protein ELE36_17125 [Pseudolysobacter antarcticus]
MQKPFKRSWTSANSMLAEISLTPFIGVLQAVLVICMFALPVSTHRVEMAYMGGEPVFNENLHPQSLFKVSIYETGVLILAE